MSYDNLTAVKFKALGNNTTFNTDLIRKATGLSLAQLAATADLSRSTLYRMAAARKARTAYSPTLATVVKLANLAEVSVDDFVSGRLVIS